MKKMLSTLKRIACATLTVGMILSLGACSKDDLEKKIDPKGSKDERKSKAHGDPVKVVLTLYRGHLHGIKGFHQDPDIQGVKHIKATQTIVCKYEKTGVKDPHDRDIYAWRISKDESSTDKFRVLYGNYKGQDYDYPEVCTYAAVYGMTIRYFDSNNEDITHQFVTNGQENIHQHFFIPQDIKPFYHQTTWDSPDVKNLVAPYDKIIAKRYNRILAPQGDNPVLLEKWKPFYYFYSDTNPWNKSYQANASKQNNDVEFVGFSNPVGFKGWLGFNNPIFDPHAWKHQDKCMYFTFDLNVELLHAAESKTSRNPEGKPFPYDAPSDSQRQSDLWDIALSIPVIIYGTSEDNIVVNGKSMASLGRAPRMDELRPHSKDYVKRIALAFGISEDEVLADMYLITTVGGKHRESGAVFF